MNKRIAITSGDFNGIGPEIIIKSLNKLKLSADNIVLIGSKALFPDISNDFEIVEIPFNNEWINYGKETKEAGEFSYQCLLKACEMANNRQINAIVTAPVSKNTLYMAGRNFSGQTEVIEKNLVKTSPLQKAEMLFVSDDFRILLLTRHLPLKDVKITKELLIDKVTRINNVLIHNFGINNPKIALCSLNPHAGENGILGKEEIEEFEPAVTTLRNTGIDVTFPMPADTLFAKAAKKFLNGEKQHFDVYCACYHDQGLIPIKVLAMEKTVNMTVGLQVIRTSPAHGTAYDIAGKNSADESSMICAIKQALKFLDT